MNSEGHHPQGWESFAESLLGKATKVAYYWAKQDEVGLSIGYESREVSFFSPESTGFVEGLWKYDCGELFLVQPGTGRYLEINVSPSGAWWSCVFSDVRSRDLSTPPPQIDGIRAQPKGQGWQAEFGLSFAEIERCLGSAEKLRGNVTLILGGCPDQNPPLENLHSVATLGAVDFHRPHEWLPLDQLLT